METLAKASRQEKNEEMENGKEYGVYSKKLNIEVPGWLSWLSICLWFKL